MSLPMLDLEACGKGHIENWFWLPSVLGLGHLERGLWHFKVWSHLTAAHKVHPPKEPLVVYMLGEARNQEVIRVKWVVFIRLESALAPALSLETLHQIPRGHWGQPLPIWGPQIPESCPGKPAAWVGAGFLLLKVSLTYTSCGQLFAVERGSCNVCSKADFPSSKIALGSMWVHLGPVNYQREEAKFAQSVQFQI